MALNYIKDYLAKYDRHLAEREKMYTEMYERVRQDIQEEKDFRASLSENMNPSEFFKKIDKRQKEILDKLKPIPISSLLPLTKKDN